MKYNTEEISKKVNHLVDIVIKRYKNIEKELSPAEIDGVYYALLGIAQRKGIDEARHEAMSAKLLEIKRRVRGYE